MTSFKNSIVREDGYLLGGLTAVPLGLWLLAGVALGWLEPAVERWGGPLFVLLPLLLLGELVVYRLYARWDGIPKRAFRDGRGTAIILGGLALIYVARMILDLRSGAVLAAVVAWGGIQLLVYGYGSRVHVLMGLAFVAVGLALLLPLPVPHNDVVLVLLGLGSIACGVAEHAEYMRRQQPWPEAG